MIIILFTKNNAMTQMASAGIDVKSDLATVRSVYSEVWDASKEEQDKIMSRLSKMTGPEPINKKQ